MGCVTCMDMTANRYLPNSHKTVYMRHRRYLSRNHPYRNMKAQFDNTTEEANGPRPYTGKEVRAMANKIKVVLGKGKGSSSKTTPQKQVFTKKSVFWQLPYWKILTVRHCIDVMHVEKNICESLIAALLQIKGQTKDGANPRMDMLGDQPKGLHDDGVLSLYSPTPELQFNKTGSETVL